MDQKISVEQAKEFVPIGYVIEDSNYEGSKIYAEPVNGCCLPVYLAAPKQPTAEQQELLVRFCPGCGSVGEVDKKYRNCCPDGIKARMIPKALADDCHRLFDLAIGKVAPPETTANTRSTSECSEQEPVACTVRGFTLWLDREAWGHIIDGLILERERSEQRKSDNPDSNSNFTARRCIELITKINEAGASLSQPLAEQREVMTRWRSVLESLRNEDDSDGLASSERKAGWRAALDAFEEGMSIENVDEHQEPVMGKDIWYGWQVGQCTSSMTIGAQLATRDGRKLGNAVVVNIREVAYPSRNVTLTVATVVTDAGSVIEFTENELNELFYPATCVMNVMTHPGFERLSQEDRTKVLGRVNEIH